MECRTTNEAIFVRLDPGEKLVATLAAVGAEQKIDVAAITAGIGMLSEVTLGFFRPDQDRYDEETLRGEYEICSMQGNLTIKDGQPFPHVHAMLTDAAGRATGGHIVEATCHVTMEIFLQRHDALPLHRTALPNIPGTRIVPTD